MATKQHAHLMTLVRQMIPPLSNKLHKGQAGMSDVHTRPVRCLTFQVGSGCWEAQASELPNEPRTGHAG